MVALNAAPSWTVTWYAGLASGSASDRWIVDSMPSRSSNVWTSSARRGETVL
jgi:hypothetical protein